MIKPLLTVVLRNEHDVVLARQRAGQVAALIEFSQQDQSRIATAVSEIARNAYEYAGGGTISFGLITKNSTLHIEVKDKGPGIADIDAILSGTYVSHTGMGLGIVGARRLMEGFNITTSPAGTAVVLEKRLPPRVLINDQLLVKVTDGLAREGPQGVISEVQLHNQEILRAMAELQEKQQQLLELNRELEDTNRGVLALYAELDERAILLRKASESKTRFLSNISHELRTPLNTILSLSNLLLGRVDGELTEEQEKQVTFIRRSAESLAELVNDLLDLSKVEAGKLTIRPETFEARNLFGALRGMLRPLVSDSRKVQLTFHVEGDIPPLHTDEGKISQILRNFISNAIKFTSEGEVRVTAQLVNDDQVRFTVVDSGIGIQTEDLEFIFEEFTQVEGPLHKKSKGTGLGLPLARKLALLLGGDVAVESSPGKGSRFHCTVPRIYRGTGEGNLWDEFAPKPIVTGPFNPVELHEPVIANEQPAAKILIIDNDPAHCYLLRTKLGGTPYQITETHNGASGLEIARKEAPDLIFLDLVMPEMDGFAVLEQLRSQNETRLTPIIIHTSKSLTPGEVKRLSQHANAILEKEEHISAAGTEKLHRTVNELLQK